MIKRVIDISEQAYLRVEHKQIRVERDKTTIACIAIEDLGMLILQHPAIVITQAVITLCQQHNAAVLFCDEKHLPISVTLPLWSGHSLHTKVLREQIAISEPTRKRLWQQIVRKKIAEQVITIERANGNSTGLKRLQNKVKSGDPDNCEAQAARQYWALLMGKTFRRNPDELGVNSLLNYGYTIMRAMVARALVGTGLHPAIGLHHKSQYNGLCLADDVMEPFRPWIDWQVYKILENNVEPTINKATKQHLLGLLNQDVNFENRKMPLMIAVHSLVARLKLAQNDKSISLAYPQRLEF